MNSDYVASAVALALAGIFYLCGDETMARWMSAVGVVAALASAIEAEGRRMGRKEGEKNEEPKSTERV